MAAGFEPSPCITSKKHDKLCKAMFWELENLKERNLLYQIEAARSHGKLCFGPLQVWLAAWKQTGKLLIGEKKYLFPDTDIKNHVVVSCQTAGNGSIPLQEVIDEAVEKVLSAGGAVEFVRNGQIRV